MPTTSPPLEIGRLKKETKMSEENIVEEDNSPSLEEGRIGVEDVLNSAFNPLPEMEEEEKPEEESKSETEVTESKTDESEDATDDEPSEEDAGKSEFEQYKETMDKRQADTRKAFDQLKQANQKILEKVASGEELTPDDLKSLVSEDDGTPDGMQKLVSEVNEALPIAKAAFSQLNGKTEAEMDDDINAFNSLATVDQTLIKELQDTPSANRAAFVIKRGSELKEVFDTVKEHEGSVTAALANAGKVSTRKLNKIKEEVRAEVELEYKEKYKDHVVSSASKAKRSGTAPSKSAPEVSTGNVSVGDIFSR